MFLKIVLLLIVACFSACFKCEFAVTPDKTYFASKETLNWTDAKNACSKAGLELVSVLNTKEQILLETFLREYQLVPADRWSGYWLSGIRYPNGTLYWDTTGTEIGEEVDGWARGEPSNAYEKEHCIELKLDEGANRLGWNDYFCIEERKYLCQTPRKEGPVGQDLNDYSYLTEKIEDLPEVMDGHIIIPFAFVNTRKQTPFV
ncbi:salivary C-type lectin 2-like isoform X1 [Rhynchophorus ferrugineus]|uniref:salivary C-type lectin 2-like isoform X1 n=1 Tax=Rhynchophorus ferrugineus TaxID=354439 RepID=UPI003FCED4C8